MLTPVRYRNVTLTQPVGTQIDFTDYNQHLHIQISRVCVGSHMTVIYLSFGWLEQGSLEDVKMKVCQGGFALPSSGSLQWRTAVTGTWTKATVLWGEGEESWDSEETPFAGNFFIRFHRCLFDADAGRFRRKLHDDQQSFFLNGTW